MMQSTEQRSWRFVGVLVVLAACIAGTSRTFAEKKEAKKAEDKKPAAEQPKTEEATSEEQQLEKAMADMEAWQNQYQQRQKAMMKRLFADPEWRATHVQVGSIQTAEGLSCGALRNFCLDRHGNLLACIGSVKPQAIETPASGEVAAEPVAEVAEIRVFSPEGKQLSSWKMDSVPQAICAHRSGATFVGGDGRLTKFAPNGTVLASAATPAMAEAEPEAEKSEDAADGPSDGDDAEKKDDTDKKEKKEEPAEKKSILQALVEALGGGGSSEEPEVSAANRKMMEEMRKRRRRDVTGIAVTGDDLFVCCGSASGWGYDVWRLDHDFKNPKKIVEGLRGCCGQMDIQARDGELWVAHNGRHRVERYDRDGKRLSDFGKRGRTKVELFGGCCEPKNLRFTAGGDLLAAESGPPNVVKRFSPEGEFKGVVALADYDGGCVRTTIEISADGDRLFMLDTTKDAIRVFADKRKTPTHSTLSTIQIETGDKVALVRTICQDSEGNLLVGFGGEKTSYTRGPAGLEIKTISEPCQVRVLDPDGKQQQVWSLEVTPQALNVGPDGQIFVGGAGRLVRLDARGKVVARADAPQVAELPPVPPLPEKKDEAEYDEKAAEAKKAKIEKLREKMQESMKVVQEAYREKAASMGNEEAAKAADEKYKKVLAEYQELAREFQEATVDPHVLAMRKRLSAMRKRAVTGIAVAEKDLFVACPSAKSFGYDVWRMDHDLKNPERIVEGLRGCCGQMDIQTHNGDLYVAENARKRVLRYDRQGKELAAWGSSDRKKVEGFGSCCNPMNIRFDPDGNLLTSEASMGRIKRFSTDGEFLGLLATVELIPGCKHVPISIAPDGKRAYMLDITRATITVLQKGDTAMAEK